MKERRLDIDNIKGLLILLVVFAHCLLIVGQKESGICYEISRYIYSFHMPLFIFFTGFVSSSKTKKESFIKYIFLYILFNSLYAIFSFYVLDMPINLTKPYFSMWFLIAIIVFKFVLNTLNSKWLIPISILISILAPFLDIDNTFSLFRIFLFFPYFVIGFYSKNLLFKMKRKFNIAYLIIFVSCFFILNLFLIDETLTIVFFEGTKYINTMEFIKRIFSFIICIVLSFTIFLIIPNKKIPFINKMGKNSLWIYLLHRFLTIKLPIFIEDEKLVYFSIIYSILICIFFSSDFLSKILNFILKYLIKGRIFIYCLMVICLSSITLSNSIIKQESYNKENINLDNCIKISYIGDMLLFERDVEKAKKDDSFDFSNYFKYTKDYFGDYVIANLEGPIINKDYSIGNYYDNKKLSFGYPIEFLEEIKKNVDFVSIANNHLLDKGKDGLQQTINNLKKIKIDYSGGYLSNEDNRIKIVNIKGLKVAILTYTYGVNNEEEFESFMYETFNEQLVKEEIAIAKKENVDKIIVMNHIGTQFSKEPNMEQVYQNEFFANNGVDIILNCHAHVIQPIEYINDTLIFNCPGNYATMLTSNDQQYSSICNIYIDKTTKEIKCASITPLLSIVEDDSVTYPKTCYEIGDISASNKVTEIMINESFNYLLDEYFFNENGYFTNTSNTTINVTNSNLFEYLDENETICFIGDSITEGTKNNFHPWYEALDLVARKINISKGGATSKDILTLLKQTDGSNSYKNYIIAIGTNDIRYDTYTPEEYVDNIEEIISFLGKDKNYIILSPWWSLKGDYNCQIDDLNKEQIYNEYINALKNLCNSKLYTFVDVTNPTIEFLKENDEHLYFIDGVHINSRKGIELYSRIFIENLP